MRCLSLALLPLLAVACTDQDPVAPDTSPLFKVEGPHKMPISGVTGINWADPDGPKYTHATPSGICHHWDWVWSFYDAGDLEGDVLFHENQNRLCDGTGHLVARGPFEGEVTWNDRTGTISGMWTTNCKPVDGILSCGGIMNARGSGGLEGVHFHIEWGPSLLIPPYTFDYTGTAHY
jgi:hypothetical protein